MLASLRYTLDFKRRVIGWHDLAPARRGLVLKLESRWPFLVSLPQEHTTLRLVPDSGAGGLVLFNVAGRRSHNVVDTGETVALGTAHASHRARRVHVRELRIGDGPSATCRPCWSRAANPSRPTATACSRCTCLTASPLTGRPGA